MIGFANLCGSSGFQLLGVVLGGGDFMKMLLEKWLYITSRILPVGLNSFFSASFRSNTSLYFDFFGSYLWPKGDRAAVTVYDLIL